MNVNTLYKQDQLSWDEIFFLLQDWLSYGDDGFEDMYCEMMHQYQNTTDPDHKERLHKIIKVCRLVRDICYP